MYFSELSSDNVKDMDLNMVRAIQLGDFVEGLKRVRRSVPQDSLARYATWNEEYGDVTI